MTALGRLLRDLATRMDRIADQDADPAALTGRTGSRRHGMPVIPDVPRDRTPEEALAALDELRADQHRRMRGRRDRPGSG